jgi:hypothetical protein
VVGSCEYSNKSSVSIKGGDFLEKISNYQPLEKNSATWSKLDTKVY